MWDTTWDTMWDAMWDITWDTMWDTMWDTAWDTVGWIVWRECSIYERWESFMFSLLSSSNIIFISCLTIRTTASDQTDVYFLLPGMQKQQAFHWVKTQPI